MSKHARPSRRFPNVEVAVSVAVVVTFVILLVGSAVGLPGLPGDGGDDDGSSTLTSQQVLNSEDPERSSERNDSTSSPAPSPSDEPVAVETAVPPQQVKQSGRKLARSVEFLRERLGLADETTFRVASLNVLGHSHTRPGGNKKGWASSQTRMGWAVDLLRSQDVDVVGFQEFEPEQFNTFNAITGSSFDVFPGPIWDRGSIRNSIAWRTDTWEFVEGDSLATPYFGGQYIRRAYIKLRHLDSGREVWFYNTHNPADVRGNAARWRGISTSLQADLANRLGADGTPVVFTGDYNDRAEVFCKLVGTTALEAANGGEADGGGCSPPPAMDVDWVFGSGMTFTSFLSMRDGLINRTTDHPLIVAEAYIPEEPLDVPGKGSGKGSGKASGNGANGGSGEGDAASD